MKIHRLKEIINAYDQHIKFGEANFLAVLNDNYPLAEEAEIVALKDFLRETEKDDDDDVTYEEFQQFLAQSNKHDLISESYLQSGKVSARIFQLWKIEPVHEYRVANQKFKRDLGVNRAHDKTGLIADEIFTGPDVPPINYYRINVYNKVLESDGKIKLYTDFDYVPEKCNVSELVNRPIKEDNFFLREYFASYKMTLTEEWQNIPSTSVTGEKITALEVPCDVELQYVYDIDCYQIRAVQGIHKDISVRYNGTEMNGIYINRDKSFPTSPVAEAFIRSIRFRPNQGIIAKPAGVTDEHLIGAIANLLRTFTDDALPDIRRMNDYEILNARLEHRVGVCEDRCLLFMMFANRLNIPARFVGNGVHAFIEPEIGNERQICLGGGKLDLKINRLMTRDELTRLTEDHIAHRLQLGMLIGPQPLSLNIENFTLFRASQLNIVHLVAETMRAIPEQSYKKNSLRKYIKI